MVKTQPRLISLEPKAKAISDFFRRSTFSVSELVPTAGKSSELIQQAALPAFLKSGDSTPLTMGTVQFNIFVD
ncbi:MAG: hypothetical protein IPL84_02405 [Chitinophagaceae bacterium]|nr:hypothetical protein [Chitinophagaceae bacterium]